MTKEKLQQAKEINSLIKIYEKILSDVETKKTEWIDFNFENENDQVFVCDDLEIIKEVRNLIILRTKAKILILKEEFLNL